MRRYCFSGQIELLSNESYFGFELQNIGGSRKDTVLKVIQLKKIYSETECETNERHPIKDIAESKKLCLPLNEMMDVNLGQYYAHQPWLKFRFYTKSGSRINIDNLKIIDCSKEPQSTAAPWTKPTWAPTKAPSFIDRPTPPPRIPTKTRPSTVKIETSTKIEEEKDIVLGWFQRYSTSTTSTVKTTSEETTTPSKAQVQTLPAGWGDKKVATPRTKIQTEASKAATEPPEEDIEEDGTTTVVTTRDTELTSIADGLTLAAQRTSKPKKLGASSNTIFNTFFISLLLLVLL